MKILSLALWAVLLLTVVSGTALAQTPAAPSGPGPRPMLDKLRQADTNQDHKVTYEEIKAVLPKITEARFKEMDTNGDGALSVADRPPQGHRGPGAVHGPGRFERLREADKDGDKKVSPEEFKAAFPDAPPETFTRMDRNKDGYLDAKDRPEGGGPRGSMGPDKERLKAADKDGDGKVSKEEFKAGFPNAPAPVFERLDRDGDGFITASDAPKGAPPATTGECTPEKKPEAAKPARPSAEDAQEYRERLRAADKDGDGKISKEEFKTAFPKAPEERFSKMDRNGDGVISKEDRKKETP